MQRNNRLATAVAAITIPALFAAGCSSSQSKPNDYAAHEPRLVSESNEPAEPAFASAITPLSEKNQQPDKEHEVAMGTVQEVTPTDAYSTDIVKDSPEEDDLPADITATLEDIPAPAETEQTSQERPALTLFKFGFDQPELGEKDQTIVKQHGEFLAQHPDKKIQLHGHADVQGDPAYNQYLATQRANHVAELLRAQGVRKEQIEIYSWGSDKPSISASQLKDNRRVELLYKESFMVKAEDENGDETSL